MQIRERERYGQVVVPISAGVLDTMTAKEIAEQTIPLLLATAKEHSATLAGVPELLTETEARDRLAHAPDLLTIVDEARRPSLFAVATMVPKDWTDFDRGKVKTTEHVARPVRRRPRRN